MLQHGLPVWSGTGEQREHAHYCLVTLPAFHISEQGSTCDWPRERTDFPSCDPAQTHVFGKARIQWMLHFHQACSSLLVDAFHWSSISGKRYWTGLEACQLFCATSPWGRRACPSLSLCRGIPWSRPTAKQSAQSCLRFSKLISEDTIWQKMHCSFGAVTGNLQPSIKPCDGLPTHQFHQQRDTSLSLVWDEFHGTYLQIRGRKTASVKVNSLETSHYWPTSYSFISKSKKIWPIPTAHPPHDIYKQDQPRW